MTTVLIIQESGRHEKNQDFRESLSLQRALKTHGVDAHVWGLGYRHYIDVPDWDDYDLIVNLENYDTTNWVPDLSRTKTKKFLWSIDSHVKGIRGYEKTAIDGGYDLILQATPEFVEQTKVKSVWFPNCYDDELVVPKDVLMSDCCDIGFCGNINNRGPLISIMKERFEGFRLDEFVIGDDMVRVINEYNVHWNANIGIDINYRNFETMGCMTALLTSYNPHYAGLGLVDGETCFVYSTVDEMVVKGKHALQDSELRLEVAKNGYDLVKDRHTYKKRAELLLDLLEGVSL